MFRHVQRNAYISLVEAGKVNMKLSTLVEFATNLSCQPYELLLTESSNTPQEDYDAPPTVKPLATQHERLLAWNRAVTARCKAEGKPLPPLERR